MKTGELMLHGGDPIPIRKPPCETDDTVCRKGKPGQSDLTEENIEIVRQVKFFQSIGQVPDDPEFHRYKGIIDEVNEDVRRSKERSERYEMMMTLARSRS